MATLQATRRTQATGARTRGRLGAVDAAALAIARDPLPLAMVSSRWAPSPQGVPPGHRWVGRADARPRAACAGGTRQWRRTGLTIAPHRADTQLMRPGRVAPLGRARRREGLAQGTCQGGTCQGVRR